MKYAKLIAAALAALVFGACTGPAGPQGATGNMGNTGATGMQGDMGPRGTTTPGTMMVVPSQ